MPEASILVTLQEDFTERVERMRSAGGRFSKELDEIEARAKLFDQRLDALSRTQAEYTAQVTSAANEMELAKNAFADDPTEKNKNALETATRRYAELKGELDSVTAAIRGVRREYSGLNSDLNRIQNGTYGGSTGGSSGGSSDSTQEQSIFKKLIGSRLGSMLGSSISDAAGAIVGSAFDEDTGTYVSGIFGGALEGASVGSAAGPWGAAIGALAGGISGYISSATEVFEKQDDAFKSFVQDQYDTLTDAIKDTLDVGVTVAGSREQTRLAFEQRFGSSEEAESYLARVRDLAAMTNYDYDEIVGYSKKLLNSYDPDEVFDVLMRLSDASAGLDLESADVDAFINGLSRMRTTGKTTQEYLNAFTERGVDVYEALSRSTGADRSAIADMVSRGEIPGAEAAKAILDYIDQEYGGLSDRLSETYDAMVANLEDAETELNAAMGDGFMETRKRGIEAQQEFLSGLSGQAMEDAYSMIGSWQASLENLKEQYERDALTAVMGGGVSELYQTDAGDLSDAGGRLAQMSAEYEGLLEEYERGSEEAGAQMGALLAEAQAIAINAYNDSEGYSLELESQLGLVDRLQNDADMQDSWENAGYTMGLKFSEGMINAQTDSRIGSALGRADWDPEKGSYAAYAYGLQRVPYDDYPAILHKDERVLTAAEARSMDAGGQPVTVTVSGNTFSVRSDGDIDAIAQAIAERVAAARRLM